MVSGAADGGAGQARLLLGAALGVMAHTRGRGSRQGGEGAHHGEWRRTWFLLFPVGKIFGGVPL